MTVSRVRNKRSDRLNIAAREVVEDAFSFARLREEKITSGRETIEVFEVAI